MLITLVLILGYSQVAEEKECSVPMVLNSDYCGCLKTSVSGCAETCYNRSSYFTFSKLSEGLGLHECICQLDMLSKDEYSNNNTCKVKHAKYKITDLYRFEKTFFTRKNAPLDTDGMSTSSISSWSHND